MLTEMQNLHLLSFRSSLLSSHIALAFTIVDAVSGRILTSYLLGFLGGLS